MTLTYLRQKENHATLNVKTTNQTLVKMLRKENKYGVSPAQSTKKGRGRKRKGAKQENEDEEFPCKNRWPYKEEIPIMSETSKLNDIDVLTLSCHDRYWMKAMGEETD